MSIKMIGAQLIVGGSFSKRLDYAQAIIEHHLGSLKHPDLCRVENVSSITIDQIREIKKRLSLRPYLASRIIVLIPEAEKITPPAQNALLKTLEEPPGQSLIILLSSTKEAFLPTIISRCQIINLPEKSQIEIDQSAISYQLSAISKIVNSGVGERLILAEEYSQNREMAIDFCQKQLVAWREILRGKTKDTPGATEWALPKWRKLTSGQITRTLRHLHQALIYLEANVNPRLVVENLLLNYPSSANQPRCIDKRETPI